MSILLQQVTQKVRTIEMQYCICVSALDIFRFVLTHSASQDAIARDMGITAGAEPWQEFRLMTPGSTAELHKPIPASVLTVKDNVDCIYAFVHFSAIRDLAMIVRVYLRRLITDHYLDTPCVDESWFGSWTDFIVYTGVDIQSIPEAIAVAEIFDIEDVLASRNISPGLTNKFSTAVFFQYCGVVRDFVKAVDVMVTHDVLKKKGKRI